MEKRKVAPELMPVLNQLQAEGFKVYSYDYSSCEGEEITGLFWYENGRVLDIQGNSWRHFRYARDRFNLSTEYFPSSSNGSGCCLSIQPDGSYNTGVMASDVLKFRNYPTWVKSYTNYPSMESYLKKRPEFKELDSNGYFIGVNSKDVKN